MRLSVFFTNSLDNRNQTASFLKIKANNELQTAAQLQHGHSVLHTIRVTIIVSHAMIPKTICKAHNRLITC